MFSAPVRRRACAALVVAAALLFGPPAADAEPRIVQLGYDFYGGGLHLASIETESRLDAWRYQIDAILRTKGIFDLVVGLKLTSRAEGRLDSDGGAPSRFRSVAAGRWTGHRIELDFTADGTAEAKVTPPADDDDRDPVPVSLRRGVFDPLSASLLTALFLDPDAACRRRLPVFDGRRRFDIQFTALASETLIASDYSHFAGTALKCGVTYRRVAGFRKEPLHQSEPTPITVWLAHFEEAGLTLPVRMEAKTRWGVVLAHLARFKVVRPGDLTQTKQ